MDQIQLKKGVFVISFDFEQHWGVLDSLPLEKYRQNLLGEKTAIPKILEIFKNYGIHATWATVGFLFAKSKFELKAYIPKNTPTYANTKYSPYAFFSQIGNSEQEDPLHFAPSLIEQILNTPNQEIATHTFCHYYCLEKGQTKEQFFEDLRAAIAIAKPFGVTFQSIVFPRNQYNKEYLPVLQTLGIKNFRGVEASYIYQAKNFQDETSPLRRLGRLADSYFNFTGHHTYNHLQKESGVLNIPSSRFLRPFSPGLKFLERLKIRRILKSMTYAAKNNQLYHLWWHPHNFGVNQEQNFAQLKTILDHFAHLQNRYGMVSLNMAEAAKLMEPLFVNRAKPD